MEAIELFFKTWCYTATALMSFSSFSFICYRVYKSHKEGIQDKARADQRKEWQAEFFDKNIDTHDKLQDKYENLLVEVTELKSKN
jgi:hypothetical protein